jgi:hypothetical protein
VSFALTLVRQFVWTQIAASLRRPEPRRCKNSEKSRFVFLSKKT